MNDELLKSLWQSQPSSDQSAEALLGNTRKAAVDFDRSIVSRNRREIIIAWILMPLFAGIAYIVPPLLSKVGALLIVPACLLIIYKLRSTRNSTAPDHTSSLLDFLSHYKAYVLKERRLLKTTMIWYALPVAIPMLMFFIGLGNYVLAIAALLVVPLIHIINSQAVSSDVDPLIRELDEAIASLRA
jgi:VIT1/CCC1 family predicted Fe2+/Mn2+ transporter